MQSIQFNPKISTDLQIDWRRPGNGQPSDLFADLLADRLKQRFDTARREPGIRRHEPAADPVSGRTPRLTLTHPRTLRGEAKRVEDAGASLPDQRHRSVERDLKQPVEDTDDVAENASATEQSAQNAMAEAGSEATLVDGQAGEEDAQSAQPVAVIVVPTQSMESAAPTPEPETALVLPAPASEEYSGAEPEQVEHADSPTEDDAQPKIEAAPEQRTAAAMAQAGLSEVATALNTGEAAPAGNGNAPVVATQADTKAAAARPSEGPLLQTLQTPAKAPDLAPHGAVHRPTDRSSMDIKLRQGLPARPPATPNPTPPAAAAQAAPPHQAAAVLQPGTSGGFGGMGDLFEPFSPDGSGPGWTLHLAQGAASKRADFIAQLRQHLQNLPAHEQVAVHIQRAVRDGSGKLSVQLSPAELGRIHVKLEINEDKRVTASVTVERPSTLELLQRDIKGLERALHNAGLSMEGGDLSFSLGRGSDREFAEGLSQSAGAADGSVHGAEPEDEQPAGSSAQVTDTAGGVVDLQV